MSQSWKAFEQREKANYRKLTIPCCGNCLHSWTELNGCFECKLDNILTQHHAVCDRHRRIGEQNGTNG